jgi:hypothetical protein
VRTGALQEGAPIEVHNSVFGLDATEVAIRFCHQREAASNLWVFCVGVSTGASSASQSTSYDVAIKHDASRIFGS